jgi:uncharacterized protein YraI
MADIENMRELDLDDMAEVAGGSTKRKLKATGTANIRIGPGKDFAAIGRLSEGQTLDYLGKYKMDDNGVK